MSAADLRTRALRSIRDVKKDDWNACLAPNAAPVLRWEWLDAMEASGSAIPNRGWTPLHLTAWSGSQLVGVAPAYFKSHSMGEYIYDFSWAQAAGEMGVDYYPKLIIGAPLSPITGERIHARAGTPLADVRQALLTCARKTTEIAEGSSFHLLFPTEEEATAACALEPRLFRRLTMQYHWANKGFRTYEDYLARFTSKRRHQLRRERAAAEEQGITISTVRGKDITEAHADLAYRFYHSTSSKSGFGMIQLTREFFSRVFEAMPDVVEMVLARRGDKVIAGAFNLAANRRLYGRYWGCFEEVPFLHFNVCLYHSIEDCIARGFEAFEPGAGGEHKISRGFAPTGIHSAHFIVNPQLERLLKNAAGRERLHIRDILAMGEQVVGFKEIPNESVAHDGE